MKLLYIWIKDGKKILKSKDFNFTEEYSFSYNEHSQELNCKVSDNPLNAKDFFTIQENKNNVEMVKS